MASASEVGDEAGQALSRTSAISIRIVPCVGRDEAWGVHRIRAEFPVSRGQCRISLSADVAYRKLTLGIVVGAAFVAALAWQQRSLVRLTEENTALRSQLVAAATPVVSTPLAIPGLMA